MAKAEDKMTLVRLRKETQLTLPAPVRRALNVEEGDYLEAEIVKDGVLLKPVTIARRKEAWRSVLKAAASVKDAKPKARRGATPRPTKRRSSARSRPTGAGTPRAVRRTTGRTPGKGLQGDQPAD
jgi:AbrB family looped-hinge helix DNA binding protein